MGDALEDDLHLVDDSHVVVLDVAHHEFLGEAAQDLVEGVPELDAVGGAQGPVGLREVLRHLGALEHRLAGADHLGDAGGGVLELLVLDELVDQFPARVDLLLVAAGRIDGLLVLGQQHPAFDLHERGGHDEELAGQLELEVAHGVERVEVLLGDLHDRDVVDIQFVLADQEQQQVQRSFEDLELDAIIGVGDGRDHGGMQAEPERPSNGFLAGAGRAQAEPKLKSMAMAGSRLAPAPHISVIRPYHQNVRNGGGRNDGRRPGERRRAWAGTGWEPQNWG